MAREELTGANEEAFKEFSNGILADGRRADVGEKIAIIDKPGGVVVVLRNVTVFDKWSLTGRVDHEYQVYARAFGAGVRVTATDVGLAELPENCIAYASQKDEKRVAEI